MISNSIVPIFDGHNDTILRAVRASAENPFDFFTENATGHLDLPRARRGGMAGGIFAIFTPAPPGTPKIEPVIDETGYRQQLDRPVDPDYACQFTEAAVDTLLGLIHASGGQVRLATSAAEIEQCMAQGILAVVMHFEGAEAIRADLSNLEAFYQRGLRSLGLVWSRPNAFAEGVPFAFPSSPDTGPGLTAAGRDLVRACNQLGVLIDLAHINEQGFWDVARLSTAPLVVSHTDVHALVQSTRNITDKQIDAIGASGGLIGLNFEPMQIGQDGRPAADVPLENLVRHVDYIANRIGIDHVAIGSDFDGTNMPSELKDAAGLQNIIQALRSAGYDQESIKKVAYRNWMRIFAGL